MKNKAIIRFVEVMFERDKAQARLKSAENLLLGHPYEKYETVLLNEVESRRREVREYNRQIEELKEIILKE